MVIPVIRRRQGPESIEMMKEEIGVEVLTSIFAWRKEVVLWEPLCGISLRVSRQKRGTFISGSNLQ